MVVHSTERELCQPQPKKMQRKTTKEKSNVVVEGRITRLRSKSIGNTTTTHQNSPTSSSKYLSPDAKAVLSRCASVRSAKRFKETKENVSVSKITKSVNESTPMMMDAPDSNKSTSKVSRVQESEHHSTTETSIQLNAMSPAPVISTATPSRYPSQHSKMRSFTLRPAMRSAKVVEHNDIMLAGTVDRGIPTTKGTSNIEEVTSKLVTQNQKSDSPPSVPNRDLNPASASAIASNVIGGQIPLGEANVASNVIEERPEESANNPSPSIGLTEMANMWADDTSSQDEVGSFGLHSLVTVQGYRVKEASAPVLRKILEKHGDIAMNCNVTRVKSRSFFLEMICEIIIRLQEADFEHITPVEIKEMIDLVVDCKTTGVEVGWLHERLDKIKEAKKLVKNYPTLKEDRDKNNQLIKETSRELEDYEAGMLKRKAEMLKLEAEMLIDQENISLTMEKLNTAHGEAKRINQTISDAKAKVSGFVRCSLVDGLM